MDAGALGYGEGDWFVVPLRDGRFAVGVVARVDGRGVVLGYFFGPATSELPTLTATEGLKAEDAVLVGMSGDLGLREGQWTVLGRLDGWERSQWPMPVFVRYEELTGRSFQVFYGEENLTRPVRELQVPPGVSEHGPKNRLMGAGYVEKLLTKILG